ncbi:MAG: hypothetical protein KAW47_05635 [Thermoplasmatales archaeon]|jgi:hypothetical protein|nr:hypothetical protein [Thermoplasmatales archaeon]
MVGEDLIMEKQGFHRWAWLVVFLLGGLLMLYGGAQDMSLFFSYDLAPVPPWRLTPPLVGLICGLIVLVSAGLNIVWGWQLRRADVTQERKVARWVVLVSCVAMIADLVSGYYGFGSLMALLTGVWLMMKRTKMGER